MDAIKIRNLEKKYGKFKLNIEELNIEEGYITGFIGPNGSGKTTTIKMIMNMISKDKGSIVIFGKDNVEDEIRIREQVGFISDKSGFFEDCKLSTIKKNISRFYKNWDEELYKNYIDKFELDEKKAYIKLSKGQQKKFEIAIAFSHHPKFIVLDEPTANLDPIFRNEFLDILQERIEKDGATVFFSSHITSDLDKVGDYIVFIYEGEIILTGEKDVLLEKHCLIKGNKDFISNETKDIFIDVKHNSFGFEGLTDNREKAYELFGDEVVYDRVNLEDMLVHYVDRAKKSGKKN